MKNLLLCLLLAPILLPAQQAFGKDAIWHFSFSEYGYNGYLEVNYTSDTLMNGLTWQKFSISGLKEIRTGPLPGDIIQTTFTGTPVFTHSRNDSVFRKLPDNSAQLLYDFNTQIGDSWQYDQLDTNMECYDTPIATVVDIGFDTIDGHILKYWLVQPPMDTIYTPWDSTYRCSASSCLSGKIYKDFGGEFYRKLFTPLPNYCGDLLIDWSTSYSLRCFSNSNISINVTNQDCDYWTPVSLEETEITALDIYPNPSSGIVHILTESRIEKVEIFDARGRKLSESLASPTIRLPEKNGLYILSIKLANQPARIEKIIRE
jgi:hypothetical protein